MTRKELNTLQPGDTVIHKQSGKSYTFHRLVKMWDGIPPNATNERMVAVCTSPAEANNPYANFQYFEAKHIKKG